MSKNNSLGILQNLRSKLDVFLSFRIVDDHCVIRLFGLKFCKKFPVKVDFQEVTEYGVTETKRNPKIIVSLTTFPARIDIVYKTISTLMQQTVKPDEIILWLAEDQFPDKKLPENLTRLEQFGLTIKWCNDIRSYKKLIPTLREFPNDVIITVDDDYYYDKNLIKTLLKEAERYPGCIIGGRAFRFVIRKNKTFKLIRRSYIYDDTYLPSYLNPFIGFGGVLYPPHSVHKDILDEETFMKVLPTNDDTWFWVQGVRNRTKFVPCKDSYKLKYYTIEDSQEIGLYKLNGKNSTVGMGGEDSANMFMKMYPDAKEIIDEELGGYLTS